MHFLSMRIKRNFGYIFDNVNIQKAFFLYPQNPKTAPLMSCNICFEENTVVKCARRDNEKI